MASPPSPPYLPPSKPPATALPWPDLFAGTAAVTRRLVAAHSRHFLALSSLFLLPPSLLLLSLPSPHFLPPSPSLQSPPPQPPSLPLPPLLTLLALLLYLGAFAAVASSAHAGFFGRPVKLLASLLSVPSSLPRLLVAFLPASLPLLLLPLSPPAAAVAVLGVLAMVPFWSLTGAAAVIESTYGCSPLHRSCRLLAGVRCAMLCAFLVFAAGTGLTLWGFGGVAGEAYRAGAGWAAVAAVVVKAVAGTAVLASLMLYGMVANVVLYMHCRALHGDLAGEIYDEFAGTYVFLPLDDGKARHVVSVSAWP